MTSGPSSCEPLFKITSHLLNKLNRKKNEVINSIGHRHARNVSSIIAKTAQVLYGICDWE